MGAAAYMLKIHLPSQRAKADRWLALAGHVTAPPPSFALAFTAESALRCCLGRSRERSHPSR